MFEFETRYLRVLAAKHAATPHETPAYCWLYVYLFGHAFTLYLYKPSFEYENLNKWQPPKKKDDNNAQA